MEDKVREAFYRYADVRGRDECWPWTGWRTVKGYGRFTVNFKTYAAHRISLEIGLGRPIAVGKHACHSCDKPWCVNPSHLWEGDALSNTRDMLDKGRNAQPSGEHNGNSKLKAVEVEQIRVLYSRGIYTLEGIGRAYGVDPQLVARIARGEIWKEAPGPIHTGPMHKLGEYGTGASARRAKFNNEQVREMRERYAVGGIRMADLAEEFGVNEETIRTILKGRRYPDAGGPLVTEDGRSKRWCR